jgi:hypothetical protein
VVPGENAGIAVGEVYLFLFLEFLEY